MQTLEDILNTPVIGNAHSDRVLFDKIHHFVMCPGIKMSDKVQAITKLDRAMDSSAPAATEQDVLDYIAFEQQ